MTKFTVTYKEAGDRKRKTVWASTEERAKEEVFEYMNMFNVTDVKVKTDVCAQRSNGKEGVGNPRFYK